MTSQRKVLIIEDNSDIQQLYKLSFEAGGYKVKTSNNGLDGMNDAVDFMPDVILLDIMMPEMNGFEVLRAFVANTSLSIPVIVISNLSQENDKQQAIQAGAALYLVKSDFEGPDLVAKVDEYMNRMTVSTNPRPADDSEPEEKTVY